MCVIKYELETEFRKKSELTHGLHGKQIATC